MENSERNENLNILNLEDESWNNSWPVEVRIDTPEDLINEEDTKKYDSDSDFMGFEDVIPVAEDPSKLSKKTNRCPHCDYSTSRKDHFKRHVLRHPEQTLYPLDVAQQNLHYCYTCGYNTVRADHFKRHMMCHTGEKPYSCSCGYSSTHSVHIKRHALRHGHTPNPRPPIRNKEKQIQKEVKAELVTGGGSGGNTDDHNKN